ncbi:MULTISPECIES: hypothetical protein [Lysinibacillus]|jgi:hypothetical protein|uniref:hypothetical protein n=1 Tax=Lysinibacillus TaxID=400634 RepID=UPI00055A8F20|nr:MULTISPECIES: hypothetical protein [Lysinibacillus]MEE3805796.1 hypothetical protein [Lysinibacillus fusiformis]KUF34515.1 hypothetical protein AK833_09395 [Lysinibacillus sp. F5]WCH46502.1 hypothetical protein NV349_15565 [Lysinibacillus sp. OF-1]SCY73116.1 hypothetical protein SAMN02787078_02289 [Lysinibacillus sp. SG9]SDB35063.1 hypothetical protein SAMN02787079_02627 [Lysinibacillus sp. TC-37]
MEKIYQMEYRGLNLFDEISTVELAIDEEKQTIHIFDVGQVVSPIFNFDVSAYELSDGFYKMADVLRHKKILTNHQADNNVTLSEWLIMNNAYFYIPQKRIKKYMQGSIIEIVDRAKEPWLFDDYVQRV